MNMESRLADNPICGTARHMPPLMSQTSFYRKPFCVTGQCIHSLVHQCVKKSGILGERAFGPFRIANGGDSRCTSDASQMTKFCNSLSCVKFRLGNSPLCRTARHMPPLMRQAQAWRQPHLQNQNDPTKIDLPIYIKLRFFGNLPCMSKGNRHSH